MDDDYDKHIKRLNEMAELANDPTRAYPEPVIAQMIAEFGALIATTGRTLDKTQRRIMWLTWAVAILTVALVAVALFERFWTK